MVIVVSGKARHGKSSTLKILREHFPTLMEIQIVDSLKNLIIKHCDWDGREETKPRTLLQSMGNYVRFDMNKPNLFVTRAIEDIQLLSPINDLFIVSDCRFKNELNLLKESFSDIIAIRINRLNFESPLTKEQQEHITETDLDDFNDWDFYIEVDKKEDLRIALEQNVIPKIKEMRRLDVKN